MSGLSNAALILLLSLVSPAFAANNEGKGPPGVPGVVALPGTLPVVALPAVPEVANGVALPAAIPQAAALPAQVPAAPAVLSPAARVGEVAAAVAPQLETIARPASSDASAATAGQAASEILQGAKPAQAAGVLAVAGQDGASAPAVLPKADSGGSARPANAPPGPSSSLQRAPRKVDGGVSYELRRAGLRFIAAVSSVVMSLPQAGPRLTARLVASAAAKNAVLADCDKTLAPWGKPLSPEIGREMAAVVKAGKVMAVISDRPALMRTSKVPSLAESLSSIPPSERAGIVVAGIDGYVFQYDSKGEPEVLHQEPPISAAEMALIKEAAQATIARLESFGTGLAFEDPGLMTYSLVLKTDTKPDVVEAVAKVFRAELKARGIAFPLEERNPGPGKEPYLNLKKIDKTVAARFIADRFKLEAGEVVIIGDSMYVPPIHPAKGLAKTLRALAERLTGRPAPAVGTESDLPMQKAVPGALMFSVGETADPRAANTFVLDGAGPEATLPVLRSVASRAARKTGGGGIAEPLRFLAVLLLIVGVLALNGFLFYQLMRSIVEAGAQMNVRDPFEEMFP